MVFFRLLLLLLLLFAPSSAIQYAWGKALNARKALRSISVIRSVIDPEVAHPGPNAMHLGRCQLDDDGIPRGFKSPAYVLNAAAVREVPGNREPTFGDNLPDDTGVKEVMEYDNTLLKRHTSHSGYTASLVSIGDKHQMNCVCSSRDVANGSTECTAKVGVTVASQHFVYCENVNSGWPWQVYAHDHLFDIPKPIFFDENEDKQERLINDFTSLLQDAEVVLDDDLSPFDFDEASVEKRKAAYKALRLLLMTNIDNVERPEKGGCAGDPVPVPHSGFKITYTSEMLVGGTTVQAGDISSGQWNEDSTEFTWKCGKDDPDSIQDAVVRVSIVKGAAVVEGIHPVAAAMGGECSATYETRFSVDTKKFITTFLNANEIKWII